MLAVGFGTAHDPYAHVNAWGISLLFLFLLPQVRTVDSDVTCKMSTVKKKFLRCSNYFVWHCVGLVRGLLGIFVDVVSDGLCPGWHM